MVHYTTDKASLHSCTLWIHGKCLVKVRVSLLCAKRKLYFVQITHFADRNTSKEYQTFKETVKPQSNKWVRFTIELLKFCFYSVHSFAMDSNDFNGLLDGNTWKTFYRNGCWLKACLDKRGWLWFYWNVQTVFVFITPKVVLLYSEVVSILLRSPVTKYIDTRISDKESFYSSVRLVSVWI